jgi:hypothetical protein
MIFGFFCGFVKMQLLQPGFQQLIIRLFSLLVCLGQEYKKGQINKSNLTKTPDRAIEVSEKNLSIPARIF